MIFPSKLSHSTFGQLLTMTPKSSIQFLGKEIIRILYANGLFTIAAAILLTDSVLYLHFGLMHSSGACLPDDHSVRIPLGAAQKRWPSGRRTPL